MVTLGIQNCNPTNIRYSVHNPWVGQVGHNKGFCKFSTFSYGVRAAIKLLRRYQKNGCYTIRDILYRWTPPSENKTVKYVEEFCNEFGQSDFYSPDFSDTSISGDLFRFLSIQCKYESAYILTYDVFIKALFLLEDSGHNKKWVPNV